MQRGTLRWMLIAVAFYNTNLEHLNTYQDVRAAQIDAIYELVANFTEPTILAGDLNAVPTAPELAPLYQLFFDAWELGGDGGPGYTYSADPALDLDRRIDYVLVSEDVVVLETAVVQNALTGIASNHFPVLVDVELPGAAVGRGRGHRK